MEIFGCITIVLALSCAGISTFLLTNKLIMRVRKRNLSRAGINSNNNHGNKEENKLAWFYRNGINFLKPACSWIIKKIPYLNKLFRNIVFLLTRRGYTANIISVMSSSLFFIFLIALIISLVFRSIVAGIAIVLCCCVCVTTGVNSAMEKRKDKIRESIPDVLRSMETCFQAGYTLLQTFDHVSQESSGFIKQLFSKSNHVLRTGGTVSKSLKCLQEEDSVPELVFIAVALDIQHQTGGSMKPVLDSAKDMMDGRLELLRSMKVQTAQAKLSARVVTIMPFALIAVFSLISPNFLTPFFSSVLGFLMFAVACLMQMGGVVLVRKMLKIEV